MIDSIRTAVAYVFICVVAASNAQGEDDAVRVGLIDTIAGSELRSKYLPKFQSRLVAVDATGSHQRNSIALLACDSDVVSVDHRSIQGACGRPVELPTSWPINGDSRLFRGVAGGPGRPDYEEREKLKLPMPASGSVHFDASNTPNDVVLLIDQNGNWNVGCDWDCDLSISEDESFVISSDRLGTPHLIRGNTPDDPVLLLQADNRKERTEGKPQQMRLHTWAMTGSSRFRRWPLQTNLLTILHEIENSDYELVFLDAGDGPADLAASMSAAKKHGCDFVLVNLDMLFYPTTDAAQLVADLSRQIGIPALVNHRTTVSPDFVVHPSRRMIPDVAEFQFRDEPKYANALRSTVQSALTDQEIFKSPAVTQELADPETYFADVAKELRFDQLVDCGETHCAARVPDDAIGAIRVRPSDFPSRLGTLYDSLGRRISGSDHGNGIAFDWAPPAEVALSRGGYVVMTKEAAISGNQITWSRGNVPEIRIDSVRESQPVRVRLTNKSELPQTLQLSGAMRLSRLRQFDESDVPNAVKAAASHILNRPMVRSWWYPAAPRHGSIAYHPLFQEVIDGQLPAWENSDLQYWTIAETGWVSGSGPMGDLGVSTTQRGWILVQAAATNQNAAFGAPKLVQSISGRSQDQPKWKRVSHAKRKLNPADPKSASVWVDEFQSRVGWPLSGEEDVMWCALHQTDAPRGPPVRFLSFEMQRTRKELQNTPAAHPWISYYDNDVTAQELQHRLEAGEKAESIVAKTVVPDANSDDLIKWRRYLLAIDQPSVRKQRLDRVVSIAHRVLKLCETQLRGLPVAEDPYQDEIDATAGARSGASSYHATGFRHPNTPAKQRLYAWAADAAYRRVRAIGYRELPDVQAKTPIKDKTAQDQGFDSAMRQLCGLGPIKDWRFVLALVRYERRRSQPDKAYEVLRRYATEGPAMPWYFKKERDLWIDIGWEPLIRLGHARWFLRQQNEPVSGYP